MSEQQSFKQEFSEAVDKELLRQFKAQELKHGPLYDHIIQLATKTGIEHPTVMLSTSVVPNAAAIPHMDKGRLLLTQGIVDLLGNGNHARMTPELEAVVLHEMGHLQQGFAHMAITRMLPITLLPIAAAVAYRKFGRDKGAESTHDDAHHDSLLERDSFLKRFKHQTNELVNETLASAAGFMGALQIARIGSLQSEYFCDRFGAIHGSPDAMINALQRLYTDAAQQATRSAPNDDPFRELMQKEGGNWFGEYVKSCIHAHPTLEQRVDALTKLKGSVVEETSHLGKISKALMHGI